MSNNEKTQPDNNSDNNDALGNNARTTQDDYDALANSGAANIKLLIKKATKIARQKRTKPASYYTRFLSRAILLEESGPPRSIITMIGVISIFLFGAITWASVTTLNETSIARGEIRPTSSVKPVQHLEGGIISEILVHEGDEVKKGQPILRMAPTTAMSNLEGIKARHISLILQIERLKAFAADKKPDFSPYEKEYPLLVADQKDILDQQKKSRKAQQAVILSQLDESKNELVLLNRQEETEKKNMHIIAEEMAIRQELTNKGLGSKLKLLEVQRDHNKAKGAFNQTQLRKASVKAKIAQVRGNLIALNEGLRGDALNQINQLSTERTQVAAQMTQMNDRVRRLSIISPSDGVIKGLKYHAVGTVVPPGDVVAEIVPISDSLVAEVKISPRDIGHVKIGSKVVLKIDTYNYARYGSISSSIEQISASSFINKKGETYFKGLVNLPQNYIGTDPKSNRITSGMTVVADIQTGKKTLLQYLAKPINNALDTAFRER